MLQVPCLEIPRERCCKRFELSAVSQVTFFLVSRPIYALVTVSFVLVLSSCFNSLDFWTAANYLQWIYHMRRRLQPALLVGFLVGFLGAPALGADLCKLQFPSFVPTPALEEQIQIIRGRVPPKLFMNETRRLTRATKGVKNKRLIEAAYAVARHLCDGPKWKNYLVTLYLDAAEVMKNSGASDANELLDRGLVSRKALVRVLIQRAKLRGEPRVYQITTDLPPAEFASAIARGPFLDTTFREKDFHGEDTHLVQRDYVDDIVAKYYPDDPNQFYVDLAEHIAMWDAVFDDYSDGGSSPSFLFLEFLRPMGFR
jgi:hypothetical protein